MTRPEHDLLDRLIARLDRLRTAADDDLRWLEEVPPDLTAFEAMASHRQSAARAFLKSFEQIEDQLSRAFRLLPKLHDVDTTRWFARDHADFAEKLGILDDARAWTIVVRLRNDLVHDYPLDAQVRFERFLAAVASLPLLTDVYRRLSAFVHDELSGKIA